MRVRRTNGPDLEHDLRLSDVIDVDRLAGDMFVCAFVRKRLSHVNGGTRSCECAAGYGNRRGVAGAAPSVVGKEFPKQGRDQLAAVECAAANIGDRSELVLENRQHFFARGIAPGFSDKGG